MDGGVKFHLCLSLILNTFNLVITEIVHEIFQVAPLFNGWLICDQVFEDAWDVVSDVRFHKLFEGHLRLFGVTVDDWLQSMPIVC